MLKKRLGILCLGLLTLGDSAMLAQAPGINAHLPQVGSVAPALGFNHLLQVPKGTQVDWDVLRGKVVVLEFWATWCVPCIAEIPVLNALQTSVDPAKVVFLSVDDEDPTRVESFLKKRPIAGWIGLDTSSKLFERYGVEARPATIVVGPDGRVASTTAHPENLNRKQLLALAEGKPAHFEDRGNTAASSAAIAARNSTLAMTFTAPREDRAKTQNATFDISVTVGDATDGHIMPRGPGQVDLTNVPVKLLVQFGLGMPGSRIVTKGSLPETMYNLHVDAPGADPIELGKAVEKAIATTTGLVIERRREMKDAYVLTAEPGAENRLKQWPYPGGAQFNPQTQTLQAINATVDQIASSLEKAIGVPVVNETGLKGAVMINLPIVPNDVASANEALEKGLLLKLVPGKREIETVVLDGKK